MITAIILTCFFAIISLMATVFGEARSKKRNIFGRPPIPVIWFIFSKLLSLVSFVFLLLKGFGIAVPGIFVPDLWLQVTALVLLVSGTVLLFLSTIQLEKVLILGLDTASDQTLQTSGIYAYSRHPFYVGFILVLLASCLLTPHMLNIFSFLGAWILHHIIMIREEQFLTSRYGEQYTTYTQKVRRYVTCMRVKN